ncbi:MAG: hypothetical protein BV458_07190 [Thermoplasmata archaeon M9B2D]|nr:MAG: hypothetical protein BV458_07190 [Thermoplasmata archaeon M9B2D]
MIRKVIVMSNRITELERIRDLVKKSTSDVPKETRKEFWKLVRQIKREVKPDQEEVAIAAETRDILFLLDRGKVYPIAPFLGLEIIGGLLAFLVFLYGMTTPVNWMAVTTWTLTEIFAVVIRFLGLFFVVALFYPCGRFIASKLFGIRLDAWCFDEYKEPTLKIDYVTFLLAPPNRRKWFFFISGLWTLILSMFAGFVGFILGGDILGFAFSLFLILFYVYVIGTGTTSHGRGEMAHYNREKKIEKSWRMKLV